MNNNLEFKYTFTARNKGFLISLLLAVFILLTPIFKLTEYEILSQSVFLKFFVATFTFSHLLWDYKLRKRHLDIIYADDCLKFHGKRTQIVLKVEDISSLNFFNINKNDDEYYFNIMSSGVMVFDKNGRKYYIFSKIKNYDHLEKIISRAKK